MPLSIKNKEAEELARAVARVTGESITDALIISLKDRLERLKGTNTVPDLVADIMEISHRTASLPDADPRRPDEILGYDANGAPGANGGH